MPPADEDDPYALLSHIQGFDSFSLSPESSLEEITRAFQTQTLIWHPDKNPADPQALDTYRRMQRAYNLLRDPSSRMSLHAKQEGREQPPRVEATTRQPPPQDLGEPPASARPFAYVDKEPVANTPAHKAGLRRGDALLRIGEAAHLRDVQSTLEGSLHAALPVLLVSKEGHFLKKWVVPCAWDPCNPASLLGCQMSDSCPIDLLSSHALERRGREAEEEEEPPPPRSQPNPPPRSSGCARCALAVLSLLGLVLSFPLLLYPLYTFSLHDVLQLSFVQCTELSSHNLQSAATTPSLPLTPSALRTRQLPGRMMKPFSAANLPPDSLDTEFSQQARGEGGSGGGERGWEEGEGDGQGQREGTRNRDREKLK